MNLENTMLIVFAAITALIFIGMPIYKIMLGSWKHLAILLPLVATIAFFGYLFYLLMKYEFDWSE